MDDEESDNEVDDEDCTWTDVVCIGLILRSAVSHCSSPSSSITFILWKSNNNNINNDIITIIIIIIIIIM